jgi:hypothetical protein
MGVAVPSQNTLAKYGLSLGEFCAIVERQGGVCRICENLPSSKRLVIDHDHVPNWKKMKPEMRKLHVRGLLCWLCNLHLVRRGMTPRRLRNAADYLDEHEDRLVESF